MSEAFHTKYRPKLFADLIGHEATVTRLKGLVNSGKIPNAILITGPSSAGKTTLARCIASELNGQDMSNHADYVEMDTGSHRTVDEIRSIVKLSKFRPQTKYKVIVLDEFQNICGVPLSANVLLKAIEEPAKKTLYVMCSMEPQRFTTGVGKALANRCSQIVLNPHSDKELFKFALRIAKSEKMTYLLDADKKALKAVVKNSNGEMRTVANLVQSLQQYYDGLEDKPEIMDAFMVAAVLTTTENSDEKLAVQILASVYACQFGNVQKAILDMNDGFAMVTLLLKLNTYLLNSTVLNGTRHPSVWPSNSSKALLEAIKNLPITLGMMAYLNATLVEIKAQALTFAMDADHLLSAKLYTAITQIKAMRPKDA